MMKTAVFAALAVLAAQSAFAEQAIETRAGSVVLPSTPPSSTAVTPCKGCRPMLVHTSASAQYFVNRQQVTLEEMRRLLAGKPDAFVLVLYDKKTGQLRRLSASIYQ